MRRSQSVHRGCIGVKVLASVSTGGYVYLDPVEPAPTVPLPASTELPTGRYTVRLVLDIGLDHYIGVQRVLDIVRSADANQD